MMYRYYVRLLPNGKPLYCPGNRGMLMDLYFTTIERLTGIDFANARKMLEAGETIHAPECEFYAMGLLHNVVEISRVVEELK